MVTSQDGSIHQIDRGNNVVVTSTQLVATAGETLVGIAYDGAELWVTTVGWTLVALSCVLIWLLVRSPWGRVVKSIREDEDAVRALGKNVYVYKMQALVLGGVLGALGGMVYALGTASANPDQYQNANTFLAYAALILGGAARVLGPVVGAMLMCFIIQFARASGSKR